jgi:hypothetical protein
LFSFLSYIPSLWPWLLLWNWFTQRDGKTFGLKVISKSALCAFDNQYIVPWDLRNRWSNCLDNNLNLGWSHIFRGGNSCADKLASHGHSATTLIWFNNLPSFLCDEFLRVNLEFLKYYRYEIVPFYSFMWLRPSSSLVYIFCPVEKMNNLMFNWRMKVNP